MIRTLRAYFLGRALREKLLLLAFVAVAALWWLSSFAGRGAVFWRAQRATSVRLEEQDRWIKNKATIEQTAEKNAAKLDSAKTLNGLQLVTEVQRMANDAGLKGARTSGTTQTRESGQLAVHSVDYTISNVDWDALLKFYGMLQERTPYIALERFILQASTGRETQLTLSLKVSSVEVKR